MKATRQTVLGALVRSRTTWTRGAELGVWQGDLYGYLLGAFPTLHLVGVDRWQGINEYAGKDMVAAEARVRRIAAKFPERAQLLKMQTVDAAQFVDDASFDFVFIDASHDEASVFADINAWHRKLRPGGMMCGHDINLPGVAAAVSAHFPVWHDLGAHVWAAA